jgi:hypothetical protein
VSAEEAEIEQAETWEHAIIFVRSQVIFFMDKGKTKAKSLQYIIANWKSFDGGIIIRAIIFPDQTKEFVYITKDLRLSFS